jgi:hypothetical protein
MVVGALLFGVGYALGADGARTLSHRRIRELEEDLEDSLEAHRRYQESVAEHFEQAEEIFRGVIGDYRTLYTHLAEGARRLSHPPQLRFVEPDPLPAGERVAGVRLDETHQTVEIELEGRRGARRPDTAPAPGDSAHVDD